jgi:hypothetical protein
VHARTRPFFRRVPPYDRSGVLEVTPLGLVVFYVDLFLAYVLLNNLSVLHHILADPDLLLGYRTLLHHYLFLCDRYPRELEEQRSAAERESEEAMLIER